MLTECLVAAWMTQCGFLLYVDPRQWIIFASSILFSAARVGIAPFVASHVTSFRSMSKTNQLLWLNTLVSITHSGISSLLALYAVATDHSMGGDYVNHTTRLEFITTAISTGYFAYDLWDYVLNRLYVKAPGIVVHHVVILVCYISALAKNVGVPLLSLALLCELQSVFMHLRKLMAMSSYAIASSWVYRTVWGLQWAAFVAARIVPHTIVTYFTYQGRALFSNQLFFAMAFVGMLFINILNVQLFLQVFTVFRKDRAASPKKSL